MNGKKKVKKLFKECLDLLKPPLNLSISEWADANRILSSEGSKEIGAWETKRTPYMIEIYEKIESGDVREAILMMASQLAKSEFINNIFGKYAHLDPCPMLLVQPTDTMAIAYSKERIAPMIRDTYVLKARIKDANSKNSGNTVTHKMFPGGYLAFIGSNSPSKLAARPIKIIFFDEVDRYPESSGREGDVISLGRKRLTTYGDESKCIITGTPTVKNKSAIEKEFANGSQAVWKLPCPHCGEYQVLDFKNLKWIDDDHETVEMVCNECGVLSHEKEWKRGNQSKGKWVHKFPEKKKKLSYHLNALASPWRTWESIVEEWIESQGDMEKIKTFKNTVLAETWEEENIKTIDYIALFKRRETYEAEIPEGVLLLTAGVDIQHNRIELELTGWGLGRESWGITYQVFYGNPSKEEVWNELYEFLKSDFYFKDGTPLKIFATCIDTGYNTQNVYNFVSDKEDERIFGIKGQGGIVAINNGFRKTKNNEINLYSVGVNALKDSTMSKLRIKKSGPGFCHFPKNPTRNYTEEYFMSLTAEVRDPSSNKWIKIRERNEGLDLRNYSEAALEIYDYDMKILATLSKEELSLLSKVGYLEREEE
ncbi:phage terminase large subunit family protein [Psychrilyobacter atlanticus]|uniref:phage terminase large subunit family protein n=1 Tax=Psychrilyobacter atlanticus TaxID=271091 RepID=UPI00040CEDA9|nr:terminase gpA endonuclease subunit [Psychrilyobacter atlanticus]